MFLSTGGFIRDIGPKSLLDAFFDTVGCRLEPEGRATRFPAIMGELHDGLLTASRASVALVELEEIERGLRALPAAKVPGVGRQLSSVDAYRFLSGSNGRPLLEHFRAALEESLRNGKYIQVSATRGRRAGLALALLITLFGAGWVVVGRRFFSNWILLPLQGNPDDRRGIYIWPLGFLIVVMGAASFVESVFPTLGAWFQRRKWASTTLVLVLVALVGVFVYFGWSPR